MDTIFMWLGFMLASYAVVGNDVIQTLGTFMLSNQKKPWWVLWIFAASLLTITLVYSWFAYSGDVSYERLSKYPLPDSFEWYYLLPPLVLMIITRFGLPVSTSFLILTFFKPKGLVGMIEKSLLGYVVAFGAAIVVYFFTTKLLEKKFIDSPLTDEKRQMWTIFQWCSTGFLWSQWLIQDFANIYVYLPRDITPTTLLLSLGILLAMLAYIFYSKGGAIQNVIKSKVNLSDIRSATIVDFIYGLVLFFFKELSSIPMSTTWVFLGLLAGREIAIRWRIDNRLDKNDIKGVLLDLAKVTLGLLISIALVVVINKLTGQAAFG